MPDGPERSKGRGARRRRFYEVALGEAPARDDA